MPLWDAPKKAMASSVETPAQGSSPPQQKPLAAAAPMRTPVKLPGPLAQVTASTSFAVRSQFSKRSAASFIRVLEWVWPLF